MIITNFNFSLLIINQKMLRPLDQSLIDFQKTYREIFKQPLYEHEQYTKRQLIYNYAEIGSEFINELIGKKNNQKEVDLADIIRQWNDKAVTVDQMIKTKQDNKSISANYKQQDHSLPDYDDQDKAFIKQIEVIKKDKLITKSRTQRNINYRKQLEILFKSRNINMFNVQTMRNHFNQLKPYNHYHAKNKAKRYQDNYQQKCWADKYAGGEKEKYDEDEENEQLNYDRGTSGKRETQNNNFKSLNERYNKEVQRRQYVAKREQTINFQVYERQPNLSPRYQLQSQYQFRPHAYFPPPPQQPYSTVSQYSLSPQYFRPAQQPGYKKYLSQEQGSGHNQFYQQNFPKPIQVQVNQSSNNAYFNYESSYRGSYGVNKSDLKGQYRPQ